MRAHGVVLPDDILDPPENLEVALALWKEIGIAECAAYFEDRCRALGVDFELTGKGEAHIEKALAWFSIGEVRNLIWMCTKNVFVKIREDRIPRPMQKHLPAKFLINLAKRAHLGEWNLKPYRRPRDRAALIEVIAHQLLRIGDEWETRVIGPEALS